MKMLLSSYLAILSYRQMLSSSPLTKNLNKIALLSRIFAYDYYLFFSGLRNSGKVLAAFKPKNSSGHFLGILSCGFQEENHIILIRQKMSDLVLYLWEYFLQNFRLWIEAICGNKQELLSAKLSDIWQGKNCTFEYHYLGSYGSYRSLDALFRLVSNEQSDCQESMSYWLTLKEIKPKKEQVLIGEVQNAFERTLTLKKLLQEEKRVTFDDFDTNLLGENKMIFEQKLNLKSSLRFELIQEQLNPERGQGFYSVIDGNKCLKNYSETGKKFKNKEITFRDTFLDEYRKENSIGLLFA
ncbi:hypothetical protein [Gloeothece verrucosa]|uniref:Uncharacterized protein n=1 Tax=Gloeothece verrucosa (strain PCC 7822) TaxID=497965 RepID=E0UH97_GLOV7|nr:hypothetical protein [Gloeothece verrucosa]ADN16811.1 hypothetical protein Cyan7822_4920 [Gloeothece verrucosa PCC 7822]